jgi:CRP-like cAMP-binding protein
VLETGAPTTAAPRVERELFVRRLVATQFTGVDAPDSVIIELLGSMRDVAFRKNKTVFDRGRKPDWFYIVRTGAIELRAGDKPPWKFTAGGTIGIIDALIGRPYERDAIALSDTACLAIRTADYFEMLEDHSAFAREVVAFQALRLQQRHLELPEPETRFRMPSDWRLLRPDAKELGLVERLLVLRKVPAFARSTIQPLVNLARRASSIHFAPGDVIFTEDEESETFWAIAAGKVEIRRDGGPVVVRGPGELIESFAAFGHSRRQYTATAVEPVIMLAIDKDVLFDRMEEHFELTRSVMAYIAAKWEVINQSAVVAQDSSTLQGGG